MGKEQFVKWKLDSEMPKQLVVTGLSDSEAALVIQLKPLGGSDFQPIEVQVRSCRAYRVLDESLRLRTLQSIEQVRDVLPFVIVQNSNFLDWLVEESCGMVDKEQTRHYGIYTTEDCIDILSDSVPTVVRINENESIVETRG